MQNCNEALKYLQFFMRINRINFWHENSKLIFLIFGTEKVISASV